jgi:hypothetical protein
LRDVLRLARFLGLSDGFFLRLQNDFDLMERRRKIGRVLKGIRLWKAAQNTRHSLKSYGARLDGQEIQSPSRNLFWHARFSQGSGPFFEVGRSSQRNDISQIRQTHYGVQFAHATH